MHKWMENFLEEQNHLPKKWELRRPDLATYREDPMKALKRLKNESDHICGDMISKIHKILYPENEEELEFSLNITPRRSDVEVWHAVKETKTIEKDETTKFKELSRETHFLKFKNDYMNVIFKRSVGAAKKIPAKVKKPNSKPRWMALKKNNKEKLAEGSVLENDPIYCCAVVMDESQSPTEKLNDDLNDLERRNNEEVHMILSNELKNAHAFAINQPSAVFKPVHVHHQGFAVNKGFSTYSVAHLRSLMKNRYIKKKLTYPKLRVQKYLPE